MKKNSHNNNSSQSIGVDFLSQVTSQVFFNAPTFNGRNEVQYPDINFHKLTNPKEYVNTIEPTKLIYAEFLYLKKKIIIMHISIQIIVDKFLMVLNIKFSLSTLSQA